jgi:CHRD domain-containing protein
MKKIFLLVAAIVVVMVLGGTTPVLTNVGGTRNVGPGDAVANLRGFDEVPALVSSGEGRFTASVNAADTEIAYELTYFGLGSTPTQAHIHVGQHGVNGGIVLFLCTNLAPPGGVPAPPACPVSGTVTGTLTAADVIGQSSQGVLAGEFPKVLRAIRAGISYANVHSSIFPGGEIRGQVQFIGP